MRFDCAAGNPPFIRYQRFGGETRGLARDLCAALGVRLSGLCSSWAPWLLVTASLLRPGGRMAFVVPAEIGHAPYAAPVLHWFAEHFTNVTVVAIRRKVFAGLSEDTWLLYADGFGGRTDAFRFAAWDDFAVQPTPPEGAASVWRNGSGGDADCARCCSRRRRGGHIGRWRMARASVSAASPVSASAMFQATTAFFICGRQTARGLGLKNTCARA